MANVDGDWACVTKTPLGDQASIFTVKSDGATFTGKNAGQMGEVDLENGTVDGNVLRWKMNVKAPFPMTLDGTATIDGDTLEGSVVAGAFGSFPMKGTRKA